MSLVIALSPLLIVGLGAILLMLAEAFGTPAASGMEGDLVVDAGSGRGAELGLVSAVVLFLGAILSISVWLIGPEKLEGIDKVAPYLIVDRFSLFFSFVLCIGGALAALLAGGYLRSRGRGTYSGFSSGSRRCRSASTA